MRLGFLFHYVDMLVYRRKTVFDVEFLSFLQTIKSVIVEVHTSCNAASLDQLELLEFRLEEISSSFSLLAEGRDYTLTVQRLFH